MGRTAWLGSGTLLFCLLGRHSPLALLRAQTTAIPSQEAVAERRVPQLSEDFPFSLSAAERLLVARNLAHAPDIAVKYEDDPTSPVRITYAASRHVEIERAVGITPLYVVALSLRIENSSHQDVTGVFCSLFHLESEDNRVPLRFRRSILARGSREFSLPSVDSPLHLRYLPIVMTKQPTPLRLTIDGVSFADGTSWGIVPGIESPEPTAFRALSGPDVIDSQATPPRRIRLGKNLLEAHLLTRVNPVYPPLAKEAGIQDIVLLEVTIDRNGDVAGIQVSKGHPLLIDAAQGAVRQWKYRPALVNGQPVEVIAPVEVPFRLELDQ